MASPLNMSPWPGVAEPLPLPGPDIVVTPPQHISDPHVVLNRLREQIVSGVQDMDILLGAIAVAAQAMTDATGAALGMRRDGTVACVGRSGETAPALGARLSENSGISGECLRNGRTQRCDDTENDSRVDAEVCRHLGLRSIAAVPIRSRLETIGILEVFSTSPHAFTDEHLSRLASLAECADAACSPVRMDAPDTAMVVAAEAIVRPEATASWTNATPNRRLILRYLAIAGGVILLGLFSFASVRMWKDLRARNSEAPVVAQATPAAPTTTGETLTVSPASTPNTSLKPTPEQIASPNEPSSAKSPQKGKVVQASNQDSEPDDGLIRTIPVNSATQVKNENPSSIAKKTEVDPTANTPPQVAMVSVPNDSLHGILNGQTTTLPRLNTTRISAGVTPLSLEHRVMPAYPHQAMVVRHEGLVLLRATVSESGRVSDVKLISGDPLLARAAEEAVRQWRYHPAMLNGKPTVTETEITLNFKLP